MPRIHYCTWAKSTSSPELFLLKASVARLEVELAVLPCQGFLEKPVVLREFVSTLPETDLLLFTDGYDVLYVRPEEAILDRFSTLDAPIVFSGEDGCYHHLPEARTFFEEKAHGEPYPYLNSGLAMGTVRAVREMLEGIREWGEKTKQEFENASGTRGFFNDQTLFGRYACEYPGRVTIDTRAELFWTLASEKVDVARHASFRSGEIQNLKSRTRPCIVHVSHRRKFYLTYLQIAHKIGLSLTRDQMDIELMSRLLDSRSNRSKEQQVVLDPEVEERLETLRREAPVQKQECDRIAILFIGTGRYIEYFQRFYESSRRLFLPKTPKVYWVFTDQIGHPELSGSEGDIVPVETKPEKWPLSTLLRFRYINQIRDPLFDFSHIIYLDADMRVYSEITEEEFFAHAKPLFGVQHPGNFMQGTAPYESRPESRASVLEGIEKSTYWQGCLWGGRTREVLDLSWVLARRIEDDLAQDVIARWHDESHLNKYFAEARSSVHTYHPGYAYPETLEGQLDVETKIVHLAKHHQLMRSPPSSDAAGLKGESLPARPSLPMDAVAVRQPGHQLERVSDSFSVLDAKRREVATINETAAQIWRLCDGKRNLEELIQILSAVHLVTPSAIRDDVQQLLQTFTDRGLMSIREAPRENPAEEVRGAIQFFSFANNPQAKQLNQLKESAEDESVSVQFLGAGLSRFPTTVKLELLYEQVCRLDDDQIVCAIDGFDVFLCSGAEEIERRFRSMDCDCVISAERAYAHQYSKYRSFYDRLPTQSPYRYVNTGSLIGYAHALKKICAPTLTTSLQPKVINPRSIQKIKKWSSKVAGAIGYQSFDPNSVYSYVYYTDQQHVGKYVARNRRKLRIRLDHDTELFWCTALEWQHLPDHYRVEDGRIVNVHTGNAPSMIHVPGWRAHRRAFERLYEVQKTLSTQQNR